MRRFRKPFPVYRSASSSLAPTAIIGMGKNKINKMKILVISDLHLTTRFDQKKCEFLERLISRADKVIINGDFWSYYSCTFGEFVRSKWKVLFPLLLQKQTIYLYGNHDFKKWSDKRVKMFSVKQGENYEYRYKNNKILIEHGHWLLHRANVDNEKLLHFLRLIHFDDLIRYPLQSLVPKIGVFKLIWGFSFRHRRVQKKINKGEIYIILSHTHVAKFSPEKNYINTGFINYGVASYVWIKNGKPRLVTTRY